MSIIINGIEIGLGQDIIYLLEEVFVLTESLRAGTVSVAAPNLLDVALAIVDTEIRPSTSDNIVPVEDVVVVTIGDVEVQMGGSNVAW